MRAERAAKVVILDSKNNVLILRRSTTHPTQAGRDDLPGGTVEPNESMEAGVVREIYEETGLEIRKEDLTCIYTKSKGQFFWHKQRNVYAVRLTTINAITMSYEHDAYSWQPIVDVSTIEQPYQKAVDEGNSTNIWATI